MLILILMATFIISIFLKIKFNLSVRNTILIFLVSLLLIIVPCIRTIRHIYLQVKIVIVLIIALIILCLSSLDIKIKIIFAFVLIFIYYKNILIVSNIFFEIYKLSHTKDYLVKDQIYKFYNNIGIRIISNFEKLPNHPTILLGNYCRDRIENPLCILFPRKLALLMGESFKYINPHNIVNKVIYVSKNKNSYEYIKAEIKLAIDEGNDVIIYVNSTNQSYYDYINKFRTGIFNIAIEHKICITPVTFGFIDTYFGTIPYQNLNIKVGDTFKISSVYEGKYKVRKFFNASLKEFQKTKYLF